MITASEVSILRATFKNQILNYINNRIRKFEKDFANEQHPAAKLKLTWRLKELHKVKSYIHTI